MSEPETPQQVNTMINLVGIYLTPIFVVATFYINADWFWLHWSGDMKWGGMGLHPFLMSAAFIVINPLSIISFRALRNLCGWKHKNVMKLHACMQTTTLILAIFAVITMWEHMNTWSEDQLGSVHAVMGMFMLITWAIHVLISLFIFYKGPKWLRKAFRQMHMSLGFAYSIGMLLVILAGIVYEEVDLDQLPGTDSILTCVYQKTKVGALCLVFLMFNVYLALYNVPPPRKPPQPHPQNKDPDKTNNLQEPKETPMEP